MHWTVDRLLAKAPQLSSLPHVYAHLSEVVNDPRSSCRDVAAVIAEDAGLAARLLRIANSAFYGFPSRIDTISRAVTLVGTRQLRDLALATTIISHFDGIEDGGLSMHSFWEHSIGCAVTARTLAGYRREQNVERYFIAGLLHDIGRLVMFIVIPEEFNAILHQATTRAEALHQVEHEVLGFDHAAVGGALLKQWQLPDHTIKAVACHHAPQRDSGQDLDTAIIHIADLITNALRLGSSGEQLVPALDGTAWSQLGLDESILASVLNTVETQHHDALSLFIPESA